MFHSAALGCRLCCSVYAAASGGKGHPALKHFTFVLIKFTMVSCDGHN
jgi:hypothetical protein